MQDRMIEDIARIAEEFQTYTPVTIQTEAYIITGLVIDTNSYYQGLQRFFPDNWKTETNIEGMKKIIGNLMTHFDNVAYEDDYPFLYLREVKVYFGKELVLTPEFWRLSIAKITGFTVGIEEFPEQ